LPNSRQPNAAKLFHARSLRMVVVANNTRHDQIIAALNDGTNDVKLHKISNGAKW
jgi:hypothetical protein